MFAIRLGLLGLAAGAVAIGLSADRITHAPARDAQAAAATYVCPMHPQVTSPVPGDCPICRMALEKRAIAAPPREQLQPALTLSEPGLLRAFDSVSLVKPFDISLEMRGAALIDAGGEGYVLLHRDEAALVVAGEAGTFQPSSDRRSMVPVTMTGAPARDWDARTVLVRFTGGALAPGATGWVKLHTRARHDLVVRDSAILRSPDGPYVLVVSNDRHTLTRRPVTVGNVIYGYATIMTGLAAGESVVARRAFFLDAERRRVTGAAL